MRKYMLGLLSVGVALFSNSTFAQENEDKVKIDVTVTKDGKTEKIVKEINLSDVENLKELMQGIDGLEDINVSVEEGDIEVIVKRNGETDVMTAQNFRFPSNFNASGFDVNHGGAFMGIVGNTVDGEVKLSKVIEGASAEKAGIEVGDVIESFDGEKVESYSALVDLIRSKKSGDEVEVKVDRDGKSKRFTLELGERNVENSFFVSKSFSNIEDEKELMKHLEELHIDPNKGFLGIHFNMADEGGVPITKIVEDSPAESNGLMADDIIIKLNGEEVESGNEFLDLMENMKKGDKLELTIDRNGETIRKSVELGSRKESNAVVRLRTTLNGNSDDQSFNFNFDDHNFFSSSDNVIVKVRVSKVSDEEQSMLNQALGLKKSTGFEDMDLEIYPNPTEGKFSVEANINDVDKIEASVFDLSGALIYENSEKDSDGNFKLEIDISDSPAGTYFLVLRNGDKTHTEKIVKQ